MCTPYNSISTRENKWPNLKAGKELDLMVHACNPSAYLAEAEGWQVW
jgi:hypothetical protein